MADSSTADLSKGKRITGDDRTSLADELRGAVRRRREHPLAGHLDQPLLRVRPPPAVGVRREPARPGRREPERQEDCVSSPEADGWVRTARDGAVLTVTLDRADQLNAQTPATWAALRAVGDGLRRRRPGGRRPRRRAGPSPPGWTAACSAPSPGCAGGLGELGALPADAAQERIRGYQAGFRWLRSPGIVSIAAVQGHAIGAGAQLALACDLRVLADDAQLRLPEATLGLVPDLTGTSTLVELVGYSRALEICLTGRAVGAAEARGDRTGERGRPGRPAATRPWPT